MIRKRYIALVLAVLTALAFFTACASEEITEAEPEKTVAEVPADKAESYALTGTWISDDEQTVVPMTLHLYEDGTLVLECHENRSGSWTKGADGTITAKIGGDEYAVRYSEIKKAYFFRLRDRIGEEEIEVYMEEPPDAAKIAEENNNALIDSIARQGFTAEGEPGEIIFYGGSNFQKWSTLEDDLSGYPVRNNSIGGSNDPVRRHFIKERVYDLSPAAVFYMSSSNDWTSGQSKDEITAFKQELFDEMAETLPNTVFVILSSTPNPLRYFGEYHDGMAEVDNWTKSYCENKANFEFLNVVPPLSLSDGAEPNPDLWQSDKLHLNGDGYAILSELVREKIEEIVDNYGVTFAAAEEIPEDGDAEKVNWTADWTAFEDWMSEDFDAKEVSYQFSGSWSMEGDYPMSFYLLMNLYSDGSARVYQHSPTRGDNFYFGYWTERQTSRGNRVSLTMKSETNGDGLVAHDYSYKFFESADGTYSFGYDFGIIPGSYMRAADLTGGRGVIYETSEAFAEASDAE